VRLLQREEAAGPENSPPESGFAVCRQKMFGYGLPREGPVQRGSKTCLVSSLQKDVGSQII